MNGKLLDTNAVIALQKAESEFLKFLDSADEIFLPFIVVGELYYGANNSQRVEDNLAAITEVVAANTVLAGNAETAIYYGQVRHKLKIKGTLIPENDIWIAAIAIQYNTALVTRDEHFAWVDGLSVEFW